MQPDPANKDLTVDDVAYQMQIHPRTVCALIRERLLLAYVVGTRHRPRYRVRQIDLDDFRRARGLMPGLPVSSE